MPINLYCCPPVGIVRGQKGEIMRLFKYVAAVSVFVYSPFSGIDGIEWRFDHIITQ